MKQEHLGLHFCHCLRDAHKYDDQVTFVMTMFGNSEDIKRFCSSSSNYKNQNLVEIEKGLQLLRGIWLLILKFPKGAFMCNHQIIFPREFAVFDTAIYYQFLV